MQTFKSMAKHDGSKEASASPAQSRTAAEREPEHAETAAIGPLVGAGIGATGRKIHHDVAWPRGTRIRNAGCGNANAIRWAPAGQLNRAQRRVVVPPANELIAAYDLIFAEAFGACGDRSEITTRAAIRTAILRLPGWRALQSCKAGEVYRANATKRT